jgi:hypothetical protein
MSIVGTALLIPGAAVSIGFILFVIFGPDGRFGLFTGLAWLFGNPVRALMMVVIIVMAGVGALILNASDGSSNASSDGSGVDSAQPMPGDAPAPTVSTAPKEYCVIGSPAARMRTAPGSDNDEVARLAGPANFANAIKEL